MNVDHIGYAVANIETSIPAFEQLGYSFEPVIRDTDRNIFISFGTLGNYRIELVSPLDTALPSPVDGVLKKNGNTPYHICYVSDTFDADISDLQKQRFQLVIPPAPACAFGGRRVAFLYHIGIGLLEIVEE